MNKFAIDKKNISPFAKFESKLDTKLEVKRDKTISATRYELSKLPYSEIYKNGYSISISSTNFYGYEFTKIVPKNVKYRFYRTTQKKSKFLFKKHQWLYKNSKDQLLIKIN